MSLEINPEALEFLLRAEEGPVGRDLKHRVDRVVDAANANIDVILDRVPISVRPRAVGVVEVNEGELQGIVGLPDTADDKDLTHYLGTKEQGERRWLEPALEHFAVGGDE